MKGTKKESKKKTSSEDKKTKGPKLKQFSLKDANGTRLVTKLRWVIEAYHGRIKKWQWLRHTRPSYDIARLSRVVRLVSAACNAFRPTLMQASSRADVCAAKMLAQKDRANQVFERVKKGPLSSRGRSWNPVASEDTAEYTALDKAEPRGKGKKEKKSESEVGFLTKFPQMTVQQLEEKITLGSYQIKQARAYTADHVTAEGSFVVEAHKEAKDLLRVRIRSRHKESTRYYTWIQWKPDSVAGWYCTCPAGMRTVGCCAHVAAVIWYLSIARHRPDVYLKDRRDFFSHLMDSRMVETEEGEEEIEGEEAEEEEAMF